MTMANPSCDLFSVVRRLNFIVVLGLVALWLPATLRCVIEALPGLEFLGCTTPCDGLVGGHCGDGCNILESGLFKVSSDDARPTPPTFTLARRR